MQEFFIGAFYIGILILIIASAFGMLDKFMPLVIWTAGAGVGLLSTKYSG